MTRIHLREKRKPDESESTVEDITVILDLPPSTNKLYQKRREGGLALTKAAKKYREHVKNVIGQHVGLLSQFPVDLETIYEFDVTLFLEGTENAGWFERFTKGPSKGQRKAKTRYKRIDYDNRIKFVQDCLVKSIGIPDDSQVFRGVQEKREDSKDPRVEVTIRVLDQDEFFPERR
jgi:Holliday junction resolvase RusA-like endonuclease